MSILSRIEELEREIKKNRVVTGKGVMVSQTDGGMMLTAVPGAFIAPVPIYYGRIEAVHQTTTEGLVFYRMTVHKSLPYEDSPMMRTDVIPMDFLGLIPVAGPGIELPNDSIFCGFFGPISLAYAGTLTKFTWMGTSDDHTQVFTAITASSITSGVA